MYSCSRRLVCAQLRASACVRTHTNLACACVFTLVLVFKAMATVHDDDEDFCGLSHARARVCMSGQLSKYVSVWCMCSFYALNVASQQTHKTHTSQLDARPKRSSTISFENYTAGKDTSAHSRTTHRHTGFIICIKQLCLVLCVSVCVFECESSPLYL